MPPRNISQPGSGTGESKPPESHLDTKSQFAHRASISRRSVDNLIAQKKIPFLRLSPRLVRIPWRDALDHLRRNYQVNPRDE